MRFLDRLTIIKEGVGIAVDAIRSNKVRAGLTIMGVAVGVFVVTAMAAAVHGIRASFQSDVDAFGATSFQVRRRGIQLGGCDGTDDTCPERRGDSPPAERAGRNRDLGRFETVPLSRSLSPGRRLRRTELGMARDRCR
jgi:putative ABC transport system permease protein